MTKTTVCLVGAYNLLISCAEIMRAQSLEIVAIFSDDPSVKYWAHQRQYKTYPQSAVNEIEKYIDHVDYLFSIHNGTLLKSKTIDFPKCQAINYHNSLLPKYRGSNATAWAIYNSEKEHGITWHVLDTGVDTGPILFQKSLPVLPNDTSLSLHIRCNRLAEKNFIEFLRHLLTHKLNPIPQSSKYSSYTRNDAPPCHGFVDWHHKAEDIYRTFRALTFGRYENAISTPKFYFNGQTYIIERLMVSDVPCSLIEPGTLVSTERYLEISTATYPLQIHTLKLFNGQQISVEDFLIHHNLKVGDSLLQSSQELNDTIALCNQFRQHERYWLHQWRKVFPVEILYGNTLEHSEQIQPFPDIQCAVANCPPEQAIALICVYLFMHNQYRPISLLIDRHLICPTSTKESHRNPHFETHLPLSFEFSPEDTWQDVLTIVSNTISEMTEKGSYLRDVYYRYPILQNSHTSAMVCINDYDSSITTSTSRSPLITFSYSTHEKQLYIKANFPIMLNVSYSEIAKLHLEVLQTQVETHPQIVLSKLECLSSESKKTLLQDWGNQGNARQFHKTPIDKFSEIVETYPENIALKSEIGEEITYHQLNQQARQLATYLNHYGIAPGSGVAILMCSSDVSAIIAILAILKLGCYYIPIPRDYPEALIQNMVDENAIPLILTSGNTLFQKLQNASSSASVPIRIIDIHQIALSTVDETIFEEVPVMANDLAYVMYSSGSTGKPKGVAIKHQSIRRLVNHSTICDITSDDIIGHTSSIAFDASTFLIWGALLNGATLQLITEATLLNWSKFASMIANEKISIIWLTTRLFDSLSEADPSIFSPLRYLLVGGDTLDVKHINRVSASAASVGGPQLINGYGPTENTTFSTTYPIEKHRRYYRSIPIGKPVQNTSVFVLDAYMNPVAVGMKGKLYVGGDGVAKGYIGQPELTDKFFITNQPINKQLGVDPLYSTEDIVYWTPDGNLEFLGRNDRQVKIRGYRIDLGMIEACLLGFDGIETVYVCTQKAAYSRHIYAFVKLALSIKREQSKVYDRIQRHLKDTLPPFMVPHHLTIVESMPLNANGKIDTTLLMETLHATKPRRHLMPFENKLAEIWRKILGHEQFHLGQSFFDAGGSSLGVANLLLEIEKNISVSMTIPELLEASSFDAMSKRIKEKLFNDNAPSLSSRESHEANLIRNDMKVDFLSRLTPATQLAPSDGGNALVTGATGFLGKQMVKMLLEQSEQIVYCLVRRGKRISAHEYLKNLFATFAFDYSHLHRIKFIEGDLTEPHLGLALDDYEKVAHTVSVIYHLGAHVNHIYDYTQLRKTNVLSTKEIIYLAAKGCKKKIIFVSALSSVYNQKHTVINETFSPDPLQVEEIPDGYTQTKWVSEYLVFHAKEAGFQTHIVRPGWIMGDQHTGKLPWNNHLLGLVKACEYLGAAPDWDSGLYLLPVDFVAQVLVLIGCNDHSKFIYNISNHHCVSWHALISMLNASGQSITLVSVKMWINQYVPLLPKSHPFSSFVPLYMNPKYGRIERPDIALDVTQNNTVELLHQHGCTFPNISNDLLKKYFVSGYNRPRIQERNEALSE